MPDPTTLKFYADNAADYVRNNGAERSPELASFLSRLPAGGSVLELGTGSGRDAAAMLAAGFAVTPSDASPELAAQAEALLGRKVLLLAFHELAEIAAYDGVWASACLLHAPRDELTGDLARIFTALRPGGQLAASFKAGGGEAATSSAAITIIPMRPNCACISKPQATGPASPLPSATARAMMACRRAGSGCMPKSPWLIGQPAHGDHRAVRRYGDIEMLALHHVEHLAGR